MKKLFQKIRSYKNEFFAKLKNKNLRFCTGITPESLQNRARIRRDYCRFPVHIAHITKYNFMSLIRR